MDKEKRQVVSVAMPVAELERLDAAIASLPFTPTRSAFIRAALAERVDELLSSGERAS